jgi:hypothetical protein
MAMLFTHVPRDGADDIYYSWTQEKDSRIHHEEIRFYSNAGESSKIQDHEFDGGATNHRCTHPYLSPVTS